MLVAIPVYIMITTREKEKTGDRCRETKLERVRKRSMMAQGQEFLEKFVSYYRMMLTVWIVLFYLENEEAQLSSHQRLILPQLLKERNRKKEFPPAAPEAAASYPCLSQLHVGTTVDIMWGTARKSESGSLFWILLGYKLRPSVDSFMTSSDAMHNWRETDFVVPYVSVITIRVHKIIFTSSRNQI